LSIFVREARQNSIKAMKAIYVQAIAASKVARCRPKQRRSFVPDLPRADAISLRSFFSGGLSRAIDGRWIRKPESRKGDTDGEDEYCGSHRAGEKLKPAERQLLPARRVRLPLSNLAILAS
jgi:hypothetical protein